MPTKEQYKAAFNIFIIISLFIFFSLIFQIYRDFFQKLIGNNIYGMLVYLLVVILSIVIAPVSAMPLLPIASNLWGVITAALLSIIGWTIGAWIAFILARRYGIPLIKKFISLKHIYKIEKIIPKENIFWTVVFLRMTLPVDGLSYALGLFSQMKLRTYLLATIIGITPFAFVFAYLGKLDIRYQLLGLTTAFLIFILGILIGKKNRKKDGKRNKIRKISQPN